MLDKLVKVSSLAGALLIFCGVLKLIIYYSAFGIDIIEFLSLSEILTTFLDDLNFLGLYVTAMLLQTIPLHSYLQRKSGLTPDSFFEKFSVVVYKGRFIMIIFFSGILLTVGILVYVNFVTLNYWIIYLLIISLIQLLTYLMLRKTEEGVIDFSWLSAAVILVSSLIFAICLLAIHDINDSKSGRQSVTIKYSGGIIDGGSESEFRYLGRVNTHTFVWRTNERVIVIPNSDVKLMVFHARK
jgi:hypothetical protein